MQVLVVGYGKIGQIKASIWKSFGAVVSVYDTDPNRRHTIEKDGYHYYDSNEEVKSDAHLILDVSTPAGQHWNGLKWALAQELNYTHILIEKPLASSLEELEHFRSLSNHKNVSQKIYVNESYYCSTALQFVLEQIDDHIEDLRSFRIELSKNRLTDNDKGRFFDTSLEAIGIEIPHMLAILQKFGVNISLLHTKPGQIVHDVKRPDNQVYIYDHLSQDIHIQLISCLGSFKADTTLSKNHGVIRKLEINTHDRTYHVEFDPVDGLQRYMSRVTVVKEKGSKEVYIFNDNHLRIHLSNYWKGVKMNAQQRKFVSLNNALTITDELIRLHKSTDKVPLSNMRLTSHKLKSKE